VRWASEADEPVALTGAVEHAANAIVIAGSDGVIQYVDLAFTAITGYSPVEVVGEPLSTFISKELRRELVPSIEEGPHIVSTAWCQGVAFQKSGRANHLSMSSTPIRDSTGNVTAIVLAIRNQPRGHEADAPGGLTKPARNVDYSEIHAVKQAETGIIHISLEGQILSCNARFAEIIGYPLDEARKLTLNQIMESGESVEGVMVPENRSGSPARVAVFEKRLSRKNGTFTWVKLTASIRRDDEGSSHHCVALVEDINTYKLGEERLAEATRALQTSEARYRTVFQTSLDSVTISRLSDGEFIDVNKAFLDLTGWKHQDVIGKTSAETAIWVDARIHVDLAKGFNQNADLRDLKTQIRKRNGELTWVLMSASVIVLEGVPCVVCVMKDISGARAAEDEIRRLAFYDPLTRLPNRRLLLDELQYSLEASARKSNCRALLLVDLDDFKLLNDTLGHQSGDLYLQEVALRLVGCLREAEIVARFGGDEFIVLLAELSEDPKDAAAQANTIAERILEVVSQPYKLADHEIRCTSSIGITVFKECPSCSDEVLKQVDIALYQAKAAGRNTMRLFAPSLQAAVNDRAALEIDLRKAIKQGEFLLYYQPQVERGRVIGAEALIRWNHPSRGILGPGEFIPFAEERGLILPLGSWVIETACWQIAAWAGRHETADIPIAVNISARQFLQPDFVAQVLTAINRTGANPHRLRLELTESTLVHDIEEVTAKMRDLNAYGLKFSLDDFGTGYSSLSYLKRLPLDQLKIDRSFVRDLLVDACSGAITEAIISMGRAMGLSVIAEGVETEEQLESLARLGCNSIQGFLISRPLPLEDFEKLLAGFAKGAALDTLVCRKNVERIHPQKNGPAVAPVRKQSVG
jgi:diguanylate cyclase (GGDEF)-like protein/PAS domain S-box-containing protein